jgi:phosphoribosylformimino-5-aminoimidazole carboxamide ribotide isomerase
LKDVVMEIIPAIDVRSGRCVRLLQGSYDRQIDYSAAPVEMAGEFHRAGARWVHVVDLDGALQGRLKNLETIESIAKGVDLKVEVGGGIRDDPTVEALLGAGVQRVIIGTQALRDWTWFEALVHRPGHEGRIALGLDAREGQLAVKGWTEQTDRSGVDVARQVADWPLAAIIYTDIARDGMLLGPNFEAMEEMARASKVPVIASGGVTDLDDVRRLAKLPLAGMIIGRAIYEGRIDLAEAIRVVESA